MHTQLNIRKFETPILFLIFNRPDETKHVFTAIRRIQPKQLFISADGPRQGILHDSALCQQARMIIKDVDWACEVKTLFRENNLGCRHAVSEGITWFFEHVEQGIILEDDCSPNESFFSFCEVLLKKYKDSKQIMHISGNNFQNGIKRGEADYYFSIYNHIWGWATWKRAWQLYDVNLKGFDFQATSDILSTLNPNQRFKDFWLNIFERCTVTNELDTWDYQWLYTMWMNKGLAILPQVNLVSNVGFASTATHTFDSQSTLSNLPAESLFVSRHPKEIRVNKKADQHTNERLFHINTPLIAFAKNLTSIAKKPLRMMINKLSKTS